MAPWKYLVKCRPHLADFMSELLKKYQVFFYTAGIRNYGLMIMDVIKHDLMRKLEGKEELREQILGAINQTFKDSRLIARDDNARF